MKYVFVVVLLVLGGAAGALGSIVVYRWTHNMFQTQRLMPGKAVFSMAAARKNPVAATPESVKKGHELFAIYCTPCHGPSGKGGGLVAAKFVPPPDLTSADLQKVRTDGYWQSYLSAGGAVMPSYAEALSPEERWDVVNYLRTLAKQ